MATSLLAAAPPSASSIEKQVQIPKEVKKETNNIIPSISGGIIKHTTKKTDGESIEIKGFTFSGALHVKRDILEDIVSSYAGKYYTFEELENIASLITNKYRKEGYFVARAYIPAQNINDGVLEIAIIEGNYGKFELNNNSLVNNEKTQSMLDAIKDVDIISTNTIERAMLLINDTPGAKVVKADIFPGEKVGTSDFLIETEATNPYSAYVLGDNYGGRYTGKYRLNLGLSANSPMGYGDKFGLNGVVSSTGYLKNGKVAYSFPILSDGLRGEFSASKTTYSLAKEYKALDAIGSAMTLEARLSYPFIRTRLKTLYLFASYNHKKMKDEIQSSNANTKKEANLLALGLDYEYSGFMFDLNTKTNASLSFTYGRLSFDDIFAKANDAMGANTEGLYSKITGSIEQSLYFNPTYSLTTSLRFQKAIGRKNLDGSEDFSLGGAYGVRAFPDGEHSAENGYMLGAEFFYALPKFHGISHHASVFMDIGYAKMENEFIGSDSSRYLSDMGLGY